MGCPVLSLLLRFRTSHSVAWRTRVLELVLTVQLAVPRTTNGIRIALADRR